MKKISVIVPIYNEGPEFKIFLEELHSELKVLGNPFEVLVIDSLTENSSYDVVKAFAKANRNVKGYFMRHPGAAVTDKTNKYMLGFEIAKGEYVITMDGDGQDRPSEIKKFVEELDKGNDFVIGYKQKRKDGFVYMLTSMVANGLIRSITGVKVHDMNNGFKGFRYDILRDLKLRSGHFRFLPVIAAAKKWKTAEVKVLHRAREHGKGKFSFTSRLQGGLFDMFVVYVVSKMGDTPMYTLGWFSILLFLIGLVVGILSLYTGSMLLAIISALVGFFALNVFLLGIIIEYMRGQSPMKSYKGLVVDIID